MFVCVYLVRFANDIYAASGYYVADDIDAFGCAFAALEMYLQDFS